MRRLEAKERNSPSHWLEKCRALDNIRKERLEGFIDTSAGFTYADKACTWARHLCEKAGVKFVLGPEKGKFDELVVESGTSGNMVKGLKTVDGKTHLANAVVVACELASFLFNVSTCVDTS